MQGHKQSPLSMTSNLRGLRHKREETVLTLLWFSKQDSGTARQQKLLCWFTVRIHFLQFFPQHRQIFGKEFACTQSRSLFCWQSLAELNFEAVGLENTRSVASGFHSSDARAVTFHVGKSTTKKKDMAGINLGVKAKV